MQKKSEGPTPELPPAPRATVLLFEPTSHIEAGLSYARPTPPRRRAGCPCAAVAALPQRIIANSRPASVLRTTGAG